MKKALKWIFITVFGLIFIGVLAGACSDSVNSSGDLFSSEFTIKVTGTEGTKFTGNYMTVTADGKSESKSVEGTIPTEYKVEGSMVSTSFQKQVEGGILKVEILKGQELVGESETEASYGVVTVATD